MVSVFVVAYVARYLGPDGFGLLSFSTSFVGLFAIFASVRFSEEWYFIPVALCSSLSPALTAKRTCKEYHDKLQKLHDLMVWLSIASARPITLLADWSVFLLLGTQFHLTKGVLKIHLWIGVFYFLFVASDKWFLAENLPRYSFYKNLAGAITNIFLNLILMPRFGINGATSATLSSLFVAAYLTMAFFRQTKDNFLLATRSFKMTIMDKNTVPRDSLCTL